MDLLAKIKSMLGENPKPSNEVEEQQNEHSETNACSGCGNGSCTCNAQDKECSCQNGECTCNE